MDGQQYLTSSAQQLRVVQQLLWDVISLHLYPAERDEIRRALGGTLLDDNAAMFAEAGALADILGDVRLSTSGLLARHQLCSNPQRNLVETEIRLLIDRLHSSANTTPYGSTIVRERDPDSLLPRSGKRDKAVLDYVTTVAQIAETGGRPPSSTGLPPRPPTSLSASSRPGTSSRPPTALSASASITLPSPHSRPGTASPTLLGSRPSTASSAASSAATRYTDAPSVVAGVADKLSVATIEGVRDTLRAALLDEKAALLEDIEYLQGLLETETDLQVRAAAPPPSLAELKDYSSRLAAVVAEEEARVEHEVRVSAMFDAADQQASKAGRLRGMVDASRRPTSSGGGVGTAGGTASMSSSLTSLSPSAAEARGSASGGSVQTLVVHGSGAGDDEGVRPQSSPAPLRRALEAAPPSPTVRASVLAPVVRRPGSGGSGVTADMPPSGPLPVPSLSMPAAMRPAAIRAAAEAESSAAASGAAASPHARPEADGLNHTSGSPSLSTSAPAAAGATAALSTRLRQPSPGRLLQSGLGPGSTGGVSSSNSSHGTSLLTAAAAATATATVQPSSSTTPPHRERSPSLVPGRPSAHATAAHGSSPSSSLSKAAGSASSNSVPAAGHKPGNGTAASVTAPTPSSTGASPALRPLLPRLGSVGASPGDRRHAAAPAPPVGTAAGTSVRTGVARTSGAAAAATVAAGGSTAAHSASPSRPRVGVKPTTTTAGATAAAASAGSGSASVPGAPSSAGSAVAARLKAAAPAASGSSGPEPAVQPRALLGNKQSVVERLDEEVDAVRGGVAAILERYNIRPSTPTTSTAPAAASSAAEAAVAPPPAPGSSASASAGSSAAAPHTAAR